MEGKTGIVPALLFLAQRKSAQQMLVWFSVVLRENASVRKQREVGIRMQVLDMYKHMLASNIMVKHIF